LTDRRLSTSLVIKHLDVIDQLHLRFAADVGLWEKISYRTALSAHSDARLFRELATHGGSDLPGWPASSQPQEGLGYPEREQSRAECAGRSAI
jgi:hypothetical protein